MENVQITMAEDFGVQGRGAFYDKAGTLRDVFQNHLLQVISNAAMEPPPRTTDPEAVRTEKVKVLKAIESIEPRDLVRGRFRGYLSEPGVSPGSTTETFFALRLQIDSWRWQGVPFYVRGGKCLPMTRVEVAVKLRRPPAIVEGMSLPRNHLRFRLTPEFVIALGACIKGPGDGLAAEEVELEVTRSRSGELGPYEELLGDAMRGDSFRFAREDYVEEAWRIVDRAIHANTPVLEYEPGTWGPRRRWPWFLAAGSSRAREEHLEAP